MASRRKFLQTAGAAAGLTIASTPGGSLFAAQKASDRYHPATPYSNLNSLKAQAKPITTEERRARIEKARRLMAENRMDAVMVVLNSAQSDEGRFKTSTADSITIQMNSGEQSFQRENVLRISTGGQKHRGRNALIGASIGAGAGLGIGAISDRGPKCGPSKPFLCGNLFPNLGKEVFTPLGAIVGGLVGLALPAGIWHEVYRAR